MIRTRRIVLGGALALLAALVLWGLLGGGATQTVALPDGTRLTLHSVTASTNGSFRTGNALRRMADKLPSPWANKFGTELFLQLGVVETNLFLKIVSHGKGDDVSPVRFRLVHEQGVDGVRFISGTREDLPTGGRAWLYHALVWPRRSRYFTVQPYLDGASDGERLASPGWHVRNPIYGKYPQWQAEVLPGRRGVGERTFILEDLVADEMTEPVRHGDYPENPLLAWARLRVLIAGKPDEGWETCGAQFRDATGNRMQNVDRVNARRWGNGELNLPVVIPLLACERAGKLGVAFVPTQGIHDSDIFWLRGLDVRATNSAWAPSGATNTPFGPVKANLAFLTPQSAEGIEVQLSVYWAAGLLDLAAPDARRFVVIEAKDDQGRSYSPEASPKDFLWVRRFHLPSDAKTLDVKAAMPRVVFVEYTVGRESIMPARGLPRE